MSEETLKIKPKPGQLLKNLAKTIGLAWQADKKIVILFSLLTLVGAAIPTGISYAFRFLIDELIRVQSTGGIVTTALLAFFSFRYVFELMEDFQSTIQYQYFDRILRYKIQNYTTYKFTEKVANLDIAHFENPETQNLIQKANDSYYYRICDSIGTTFYGLYSILAFIGSFLVLIPFGFWLPVIMTLATIPRFILKNRLSKIQWSVFNSTTPEAKNLWYLKGLLSDGTGDLKEIKTFQATGELLGRLKKLQERIFMMMKKSLRDNLSKFYWPIVIESTVLAALAYWQLPAAAGAITVGAFTFLIQNLSRISGNAQSLVRHVTGLYEDNLYIQYYFDVLNLPKIVQEAEPGQVFADDEIKAPQIEFNNVSFRYPGGPKVLKNISFRLKPGEHLAIVGANGAGKTTLTKLLLRFYDPTEGEILINDYPLRDIKLSNWYKFISTLFQDFAKFAFTVKDNIILGKPDLVDEKRMRAAARKSGANEFIEKFPKQYEQRLGKRFEDGTDISIGQWQKLALARAFYEEAPILILDEPTSAIDAEAEAQIFDNLDKLYTDKTLVIISHRFSTVRNADKIIVLKNGQIAEEGNHESLMKKRNGIYATMFQKQAKGYID